MAGMAGGQGEGSGRINAPAEGALRAVRSLVELEQTDQATQLYEELGAAQRERLRREAAQRPVKERRGLVEVLRRARDFLGAARLMDGDGEDATVADLYAQSGQYLEAAGAYLRAGEAERAAAAFERAGALERARWPSTGAWARASPWRSALSGWAGPSRRRTSTASWARRTRRWRHWAG